MLLKPYSTLFSNIDGSLLKKIDSIGLVCLIGLAFNVSPPYTFLIIKNMTWWFSHIYLKLKLLKSSFCTERYTWFASQNKLMWKQHSSVHSLLIDRLCAANTFFTVNPNLKRSERLLAFLLKAWQVYSFSIFLYHYISQEL